MLLNMVLNSSVADRVITMIYSRLGRGHFLTFLISLFGLGFGCLPFSQASAQGNCSPEMNNRAVSLLVDARENWPSLLKHQRNYAVCDDGELGEGYSDAVVRLFAQRWNQFGTFVSIAKKNPAFQGWAVRHIDATASDEDLNKIILNANTCINHVNVANLCKIIRQSAENALMESAQTRRQSGQ
jgi:hypothetical protein